MQRFRIDIEAIIYMMTTHPESIIITDYHNFKRSNAQTNLNCAVTLNCMERMGDAVAFYLEKINERGKETKRCSRHQLRRQRYK